MSEKGYREYLELHSYFAPAGAPKLPRAEFDALSDEHMALAAKFPALTGDERRRLGELKERLFRDKP